MVPAAIIPAAPATAKDTSVGGASIERGQAPPSTSGLNPGESCRFELRSSHIQTATNDIYDPAWDLSSPRMAPSRMAVADVPLAQLGIDLAVDPKDPFDKAVMGKGGLHTLAAVRCVDPGALFLGHQRIAQEHRQLALKPNHSRIA